MKKLISSILVVIIFCSVEVNAKSIWDKEYIKLNNQTEEIIEETIPIKDNRGRLTGIDTYLTIPEGFNKKEIIISPDIFGGIGEYKGIMPGDRIKINIHLNNKSNNEYSYLNNSFILSTDDLSRYNIKDNYKDTEAIGFDQRKIYDIFSPLRTYNKPLKELLGKKDLSDTYINEKLIEKGYSGIEELDKYYLDYLNNQYNLNETSLDKFTYTAISNLFNGNMVEIKETNKKIIELSYNCFYNKLLSFNFDGEKVTDSNSQDYSIGTYMNTNKGNDYFINAFSRVEPNNTYDLNNMSLNINGLYTTNVYMNYNFSGHLEFKLINETEEVFLETNEIIPPDTGI